MNTKLKRISVHGFSFGSYGHFIAKGWPRSPDPIYIINCFVLDKIFNNLSV